MSATLTNHPNDRDGAVVGTAAQPSASSRHSRSADMRTNVAVTGPRGATCPDGLRDLAAVSRSLARSPDGARARAMSAVGDDRSQLKAALAFFHSYFAPSLFEQLTGRIRV